MEIRKAAIEDLEGIAYVHIQGWKETYSGLLSNSYLDSLSIEGQLAKYEKDPEFLNHVYVLLIKNQVAGFVYVCKAKDEDLNKDYGEISAIYLLKKYQGNGYGGMLLDYATAVLEQEHFKYITLWAFQANTNAIAFYEHEGYLQDGSEKVLVLDGKEYIGIRLSKKIHHYIVEEEENENYI